jgi:two-component system, NarL family, sensor histidine kinase DesK
MIFVVTAASASLPEQASIRAIVGIVALTSVIAAASGSSVSGVLSIIFQLGLIGIALIFLRRLIRTNSELRIAREENTRLAVAEERLRFARDLHDLLGHSLSLIALKSELAGRLIEADPAAAANEVRDIEQVTRDALREVREAVTGYRQPALDTELIGARMALDAAGIQCDIVKLVDVLAPAVEATMSWALREGVTNVIRHSDAKRCDIRIEARQGLVTLSIYDDGSSPRTSYDSKRRWGNGLSGLSERVVKRGGELKAGPVLGGFRLTATLPVEEPVNERDTAAAPSRTRLALDTMS